jgi:hypothetical protein
MENSKYWDSARTEITAPPSLGFFDKETLGQSRKRYFQRRKWGLIPERTRKEL